MVSWLRRLSGFRILLLFMVLCVGATFLRWFIVVPSNPVYQGHRLSWWIRQQTNGSASTFTTNDLDAMGPPAVCWLVYMAEHGAVARDERDPDTKVGRWLKVAKEKSRDWLRLPPVPYNARSAALACLDKAGPAGAPAIPVLTRIIQTQAGAVRDHGAPDAWMRSDARSAAHALLAIGPASRDTVVQLLTSGAPAVRECLVEGLAENFRFTALDFEYLDLACRDRNGGNRMAALNILRNASLYHEPAAIEPLVAVIVEILSHPHVRPRDYIVDSLVFIHDGASAAIPRLLELVEDPDENVRDSASYALSVIDKTRQTTWDLMLEWLQSEDPQHVAYARHVLHFFGKLCDTE